MKDDAFDAMKRSFEFVYIMSEYTTAMGFSLFVTVRNISLKILTADR